jgi:hypothetical protein
MKFRNEMETLKSEVASLRERLFQAKKDEKEGNGKADDESMLYGLPHQIKELLNEAEEKASAHPAATLAGVFALGIAVGRLSSRQA